MAQIYLHTILLSTALCLSSCLSLSEKELTDNVLELPTMGATAALGIDSGVFTPGNWPEKEWWSVFNDPDLSQMMQEALSNNPTICAIQRKVELARQNAKVVRSSLFPLVFFDYDETWQFLSKNGLYRTLNPNIPLNANLIDLSLSFTYEFDFWSKNLNTFRAALGRAKADEAERAQVELITTAAVAQGYFALKTNKCKQRLYEKLLLTEQQIFDLQTLMQDKALFSKLIPLRTEEQVQEVKKMVVSIEEEVLCDEHLLNILLGKGPEETIVMNEKLFELPSSLTLPSELSIDLLSRRPDLMAQIWRVEAFAKDVAVARADFLPSVNLIGLIGLESVKYAELLKATSQTAALKPAIHLPIFTAGAIRANVRAKKASFDEAVFNYNQKILECTKEVTDLIVFARSVFERKALQDKIVDEALELYELTDLRFSQGLDNLLSLLHSRYRLIEKQIEDINLLYSQYTAAIKLIKSLGGGYNSSYMPIQKEMVVDHDGH